MATISNNDIAKAIYLVSRDQTGAGISAKAKDVVRFLNKKRLLSRSKEILSKLEKINNQDKGVIDAKVWSAKKLSGDDKTDLTHFLKKHYNAKEVIFTESVDESLLGGVRIEVNDEVIDLTLKNKVEQLQEYLTR